MSKPDGYSELAAARDTIRDLNDRITRMMRDGQRPYSTSNAKLYLALNSQPQPKQWWRRLLRWINPYSVFRLKPFGEPLDPMAQSSLYFAAGLLSAIYIMEFVGWSLLFNEVLNAGLLKWSALSIPAMYFGALFAFGIIALEQAILTADTTHGWGKRKGTLAIRIILIGCSALITTQPYELLFFSSEIKDRVHQESIRSEMVDHYPEFHQFNVVQTQALPEGVDSTNASLPADPLPAPTVGGAFIQAANRACPAPDTVQEPVLQTRPSESADIFDARLRQAVRDRLTLHLDGCDAALKDLPGRITVLDQQSAANQIDFDRTRTEIGQETARLGCGSAKGAPERGCEGLRARLSDLRKAFTASSAKLQTERANIQAAIQRYQLSRRAYEIQMGRESGQRAVIAAGGSTSEEDVQATPEMIRARRTQLKRYMDQLLVSKVGAKLDLPGYRGAPPTTFRDFEYGVTNKIRVLYSELAGQPYLWPTVDPQLIKSVKAEFPLGDPEPGFHWYRWVPWAAVLLAAMFMPFVSLGYKLTLNENLNLYYVTEFQEQLGHVGATVASQAKMRFWELRGTKGERPNPPPVEDLRSTTKHPLQQTDPSNTPQGAAEQAHAVDSASNLVPREPVNRTQEVKQSLPSPLSELGQTGEALEPRYPPPSHSADQERDVENGQEDLWKGRSRKWNPALSVRASHGDSNGKPASSRKIEQSDGSNGNDTMTTSSSNLEI
jgi:hypothetical protein